MAAQDSDPKRVAEGFDEPRVRDVEIAAWLGYARVGEFRELIAAHAEELRSYGILRQLAEKKRPGRGRPEMVYWLNKDQGLLASTGVVP